MYAVSPLRYPGAKWRLEPFIYSLLERNGLKSGHYAEPFAGGSSLALSLLFKNYVDHIHLNDLDRSIYSFWHSVLNNTDQLVELIKNTPVSVKIWDEQKQIQQQKNNCSQLELGFSTFYLNRTNRSGILTAGMIGGRSQSGKWKIDARFNKKNLIDRIHNIAKFKNRINVYNSDAIDFINETGNNLPAKSLIYFDPPYYKKGQELYLNSYGHDDHYRLAQQITKRTYRPWLLSYDNVEEIRTIYNEVSNEHYELPYSASVERKGNEIFFSSPNLKACSKSLEEKIFHKARSFK
jgi:DNA adenine methylase